MDARVLDQLAANATAPESVEWRGGWQLRADPMLPFRRTNSVVPLPGRDRGFDVDARIDEVEAFYRSRQMPPRFQLTAATEPSDLDDRLAGRGYVIEAPVDILVAEIGDVLAPISPPDGSTTSVRTDGTLDEDWVAVFTDEPAMLERIRGYGRLLGIRSQPSFVATAEVDGEPAAIGFSVVEAGWVGVFGMATRAAFRRRGAARAVLRALVEPRGAKATHVYLQVEIDNAPARALYASAGFVRNHGYHYRVLA